MAELGMAFLNPFAAQQQMDVVSAKLGPELDSLRSMTRLHNANAAETEGKVASQEAARAFWQKNLSGMGQDPNFRGPMPEGLDPASFFNKAAEFEISQGNTGAAAELLNKSARVKEQDALAARFRAMESATKVQETVRKSAWIQQQLGAVVDQASFDDVNQQYEVQFGEPSPFKGREYSPELVQGISQASMTAAQRARAAAQTQAEKDRQAREARLAEEGRIRAAQAAARLARQRDVDNKEKKVTGEKPQSVNQKAVEGSVLLAIQGDPDAASLKGTQKLSALRDLSDRATALLRANKGLNTEMAVRKAFAEAKEAGDFEGAQGWGKGPTYTGGGKAPTDPLSPPQDARNMAAYKKGRWYRTERGVLRFTGSGWSTE